MFRPKSHRIRQMGAHAVFCADCDQNGTSTRAALPGEITPRTSNDRKSGSISPLPGEVLGLLSSGEYSASTATRRREVAAYCGLDLLTLSSSFCPQADFLP